MYVFVAVPGWANGVVNLRRALRSCIVSYRIVSHRCHASLSAGLLVVVVFITV